MLLTGFGRVRLSLVSPFISAWQLHFLYCVSRASIIWIINNQPKHSQDSLGQWKDYRRMDSWAATFSSWALTVRRFIWSFVSLASLAWLGCSRWFWDDQLQLTKPSNPIILWALLFPFATYNFHQRLVFWNSIHQEVASDSFCFLINYSWLLVFILYVFSLFFSGFNLYCWKGIHFS